ncbi:MAG: hypothetical protein KU29_14315 [Sulfurovum sp. FS06-10]|nr:MAG: hypothetical protein KU29_14315 [Sulfurovum sp. FS06-10]
MLKPNRLIGIDVFRGWAILLMLIFHFSFDLQNFHYVDLHIRTDVVWFSFRYVIVTMFLLTVGMSLKLVHHHGINWASLKKRTLLLGGASLLVTIGSYTQFPDTWIYFGILHFVLFASFVALPFLNHPRVALVVAIIILIGSFYHWLHTEWLFNLLVTPLHLPTDHTQDIVRFFPWFAVVLMGISVVGFNWHQKIFNRPFFNLPNQHNQLFSFLGRHSLLIYLVHQPILFGFFLLLE